MTLRVRARLELPEDLWAWIQEESAAREVGTETFILDTLYLRKKDDEDAQAALDANPELKERITGALDSGSFVEGRPHRPTGRGKPSVAPETSAAVKSQALGHGEGDVVDGPVAREVLGE